MQRVYIYIYRERSLYIYIYITVYIYIYICMYAYITIYGLLGYILCSAFKRSVESSFGEFFHDIGVYT